MALEADDALPSARYDAIAQGKLIQAIKIYREATGVGLKAKDAVEAMAGTSRRQSVPSPTPSSSLSPQIVVVTAGALGA